MMTYPGGKNGAGVIQQIINQMPPHRVYIEPFLGSGAVLRNKRPASSSIAIDCDAAAMRVAQTWDVPGLRVQQGCALDFLRAYDWQGDELVYCDPPYLFSTRNGGTRPIYQHEFGTEAEHCELLTLLSSLLTASGAMVMLSGYASSLYAARLPGWRTVSFQTMTRGGHPATETLWMNYAEPTALHDYRYLGEGFRERERIKRKQTRWQERLRRMPPLERYALLAALEEFSPGTLAVSDERGRPQQK